MRQGLLDDTTMAQISKRQKRSQNLRLRCKTMAGLLNGTDILKPHIEQFHEDAKICAQVVERWLTSTRVLKDWAKEEVIGNNALHTFGIETDDFACYDKNQIDTFQELSEIANLESIVTQKMQESIELYHKDNYGRPIYLPDMLGEHFQRLTEHGTNGLFFKCCNQKVFRQIFKIGFNKVKHLVDAGFVMQYSHTLLIDPNNRQRTMRFKFFDESIKQVAKLFGCIVCHVKLVAGIDLYLHDIWYREQMVLYHERMARNETHNYPESRKQRAKMNYQIHTRVKKYRLGVDKRKNDYPGVRKKAVLLKPKKTRLGARLIYVEEFEQYFSASGYAEKFNMKKNNAQQKIASLSYHFTQKDLEAGYTHHTLPGPNNQPTDTIPSN
jgi:hypothetical protein